MSNTKHLLRLFTVVLSTLLAVEAHYVKDQTRVDIKFYELKKGNLLVNFTNIGARIVSLYVPDKFGNASDIVLGYDSVDAYKKDEYSLGAIVNVETVANDIGDDKFNLDSENRLNGGRVEFGDVIWKVTKFDKSKKNPSISFQYTTSDNEQGFPGKDLIVTATYLLQAKNKLKLTLNAEAKDEETPLNLAQNIYWNLGGHNSTGNILHDQLRVLASNYTELDDNLVPTGQILPVRDTPYDFQRSHTIQSRFNKLKDGYDVRYVLDQGKKSKKNSNVKLAAVLRDDRSGRLMKVWTDQPVVQFSTADKVRNVRGKDGVLYQCNAGVLLAPQGYLHAENIDSFASKVITKQKPYKQTTVFQFLIKK